MYNSHLTSIYLVSVIVFCPCPAQVIVCHRETIKAPCFTCYVIATTLYHEENALVPLPFQKTMHTGLKWIHLHCLQFHALSRHKQQYRFNTPEVCCIQNISINHLKCQKLSKSCLLCVILSFLKASVSGWHCTLIVNIEVSF